MNRHLIRVMIVDDHEIARRGVRSLIEGKLRYEVVGEAANDPEALVIARQTNPHIVVLDCSHPGQHDLAVARLLKQALPHLELVLFTPYNLESLVREAINLGVLAMVLKTEREEHLLAAMEAASIRRPYRGPSVADTWYQATPRVRSSGLFGGLTQREHEVVKLIAEGKVHKEISHLLGISLKTMETHRAKAMIRLGLSTTADLVRYAVRNGLVAA